MGVKGRAYPVRVRKQGMPAMSRRWKSLKKTLLRSRSTIGCSVSTAAGPCSASSDLSSCTVISALPPSDCNMHTTTSHHVWLTHCRVDLTEMKVMSCLP